MEKYNINSPMAPLWLMYPNIGRCSIGWRMGYGEKYAYEFGDWYNSLTKEEQKLYQEMFPAPKGWLGWHEEEYTDQDFCDDEGLLYWNEDGEMKYSIEGLKLDYRKSKNIKFLFFWGHQPSHDGSITKTCFSQWWKSDFSVDIDTYCCMEQYMMAGKAKLFKDDETLDEIIKSKDPKAIKALGRKVKNFNEGEWVKKRSSIILNGNFAKFLQNQKLKEFLIQTKDRVLVEASPYDKIWGIGMMANDDGVENPLLWKGQNLLGFALMEVRDEISRVCQNENKLNWNQLRNDFC